MYSSAEQLRSSRLLFHLSLDLLSNQLYIHEGASITLTLDNLHYNIFFTHCFHKNSGYV